MLSQCFRSLKTELLEKSFHGGDFLKSVFHVLLYTSETELLENVDLMTLNLGMAIQGNLVLFNHYWTLQRHKDMLSPILFSPHLHPWFNVHLLWTLEMAPLHKNLNVLQMFHLTTPTGLALLSVLFPLFVSSPMEGRIVLEHRWCRYEDVWKLRGTNKLLKIPEYVWTRL